MESIQVNPKVLMYNRLEIGGNGRSILHFQSGIPKSSGSLDFFTFVFFNHILIVCFRYYFMYEVEIDQELSRQHYIINRDFIYI